MVLFELSLNNSYLKYTDLRVILKKYKKARQENRTKKPVNNTFKTHVAKKHVENTAKSIKTHTTRSQQETWIFDILVRQKYTLESKKARRSTHYGNNAKKYVPNILKQRNVAAAHLAIVDAFTTTFRLKIQFPT